MKYPFIKPISPTDKMHQALYVLENFSIKRSKEFLFISKRIRKDIWNETNTAVSYTHLDVYKRQI